MVFECINCGKWNKKFLIKDDLKRKLDLVKQYSKHLGELKYLNAQNKDTVFQFLDSKFIHF